MSAPANRKQKVAILGGGIGSIVTAFELTSTPELRARYDVTVYQLGWRIGGKCASGRNAQFGERIEEHGLHIWFGFYDNAFRVMRDAYEELGRDPSAPLATWRDAFKPCDDIVLYEQFQGRWRSRNFEVPRNPLTPGDANELPDFWEIAHKMLEYLVGRWGALKATNTYARAALRPNTHLPLGVDRLAWDMFDWVLRRMHPEQWIHEALRVAEAEHRLGIGVEAEGHRSLLWTAIDKFKRWLWHDVVEPNVEDDDLRFFFTMFDAGTTILQGILEDKLIERGFDAATDEDLRAWLRRHGALPITLDEGPFVRALYDMAFGYEGGDVRKPNMAAGTAIHDLLRLMFCYRGAFAWKMQAGMGDTVMTPFFEVLKRRGVRFEFFNWVSKLGLSADRRTVDTIEIIPQVQLQQEYQPLRDVKDLACWPSEPLWEQLPDGQRLKDDGVNFEFTANPLDNKPKTLRRGEDFDLVVLGISVGALPEICGELIADAGNPRFKAMIDNSKTVMTQAFQFWLNRPVERLGWPYHANSIMTAYVEPLDTYADMSQLLPREAWPASERVEDVAYFCGVLPDRRGDTQEIATDRVRANALEYLERDGSGIWGSAYPGSRFDWNLIVDPRRAIGPDRLETQFFRANFQATERYVLTPAGSVKHRLAPDESGYENLFLAGDWTRTGVNGGCVEAAVMSGMQASRAICGVPKVIVGEDHGWLAGLPSTGNGQRPRSGPPEYVDYGGLATCPSPVDCEDSTLYGFFLEADNGALTTLCNRVFAAPSGGVFDVRPLGSHVMLTFGIVKKIRPRLEPWSQMGYAEEKQVAFWVPVVAYQSNGTQALPISLGWFVPYMWVDNPLSLSGGREIYGFNKNWGWIDLPDPNAVDRLSLDAFGGDFKGTKAGKHPLVEVTRTSTAALRRDNTAEWNDLRGLTDVVRGFDVARGLPEELFKAIIARGGPPQLFLKQFRSVVRGVQASQQQITDGGVTLKRISGRPLLADFQFTLQHLDSHPLERELGVKNQTTSLAYEVEMDFVLDDGHVLWEAAPA